MRNFFKSANNLYRQLRYGEKSRKDLGRNKIILSILLFLFLVLSAYLIIKAGLFDEEKQRYLKESPYCVEDLDCKIYGCTNCGNTLWIDRNVSEKQLVCDKKFPMQIDCECQANQCKRVYR
jgi:hypothetical protein